MAFYCRACGLLLTNGSCLHASLQDDGTVVASPGHGVVAVCGRCGSAGHRTKDCQGR